MTVQAETSLDPLRTEKPSGAVDGFIGDLKDSSLEVKTGPMSSRVVDELIEVCAGPFNASASTAANCRAVLMLKVSNGCSSDIEPPPGDYHA